MLAATFDAKAQNAAVFKNSPGVKAAFREALAPVHGCVVRVLCDGKPRALGTVVGPDGWILTKASELSGKIVCRLQSGARYEASLVGVHEDHDLAMLKIEARGLKTAPMSASAKQAAGAWVAVAGVSEEPIAVGVVSVARRAIPRRGGLLGVATDNTDAGPRVTQVIPRSGAAAAGLKVGDIITYVDGEKIKNRSALQAAIAKHRIGATLQLRILRDETEIAKTAKLGARVSPRQQSQNTAGGAVSRHANGFPSVLQHDAVLAPNQCGGPLVDLDGQVIGLNIARAGRVNTYAIPSDVILSLLVDLMSGKLAPVEEPVEAPRVEVEPVEAPPVEE